METLLFQTEGFESDNDNDLTHKCYLKSHIYLSIVITEDKEAEERDFFNLRVAGEPNNYSFDGGQQFTNNDFQ